ncbi:hypothetical protein E1H12_14555 [Geitlerinema sp. P-1104]|uniref:hypothetical protein n=1 Tax=Geitlerinema sp. P-1104 TaxID=2546230 RepID=UPI001476A228|nr:hypothetical protein [Geitlerinema sp. P-1104]NMG59704.1 hypothetical protein [Geitlerinema sp. P-1104]
MSRRIVTEEFQSRGKQAVDGYFDRLIKYIPSEIIGFWLAISGIIKSSEDGQETRLLWIFFVVGIILTAGWIFKQTYDPQKPIALTQIAISSGAFVVWVFATGEPFSSLEFYRPYYGSLLLITYTSILTLVVPKES